MDRYTDLVINKIPELGFTNLLCHIYSLAGLSAHIDVAQFTTNCNGYVLQRLDPSPSAGLVSCIPLAQLLELVSSRHLPAPRAAPEDELAVKRELVAALRVRYPSFEEVCRLPTSVPLAYFFKPPLREKVSRAVDFSQLDLRADDLSRRGVHAGENPKVVRLPVRPERGAWMSNRSIQQLLAPLAHGSEVAYLGQFNLNFLNAVAVHEKASRFAQNMLAYILKDKVAAASERYVMFGFCYRAHWKSLVFDRRQRLVAFYDSGGSSPGDFHHYPHFFFYSFSDGFNVNAPGSVLADENADVDVLFRFFTDCFGAKQGCINVEVNQLLESECGMFISLFMFLCVLQPPSSFKALRRVYTFFRFLADKKMTLFKSILFHTGAPSVEVLRADSDGLREYVKMERWTRKSAGVLAQRITARIDRLLAGAEPAPVGKDAEKTATPAREDDKKADAPAGEVEKARALAPTGWGAEKVVAPAGENREKARATAVSQGARDSQRTDSAPAPSNKFVPVRVRFAAA
ncbi:MC049L [Molluscum contagiosum virus subtype 1]|uniref:MC049L n=1 Tax=Molluscum contagiosum virus subtype 1 TaxID=10280 RepID=Q98217_MCV1|nr:MC049L [Molluscum contagiosum virus subtype 1]AAC55177.1 MC049L [Molluscum contagiosum virus subtype 1]